MKINLERLKEGDADKTDVQKRPGDIGKKPII
jgi:hypothetical protein